MTQVMPGLFAGPILRGPVGIPQKARKGYFSHEQPNAVALVAQRTTVAYPVSLNGNPFTVKLDETIPEPTRKLFLSQFDRLGKMGGAEKAADLLGITIFCVPASPSLVMRLNDSTFAVNQFYFELLGFLHSDAMVFQGSRTRMEYPPIPKSKSDYWDRHPAPHWLFGRTKQVHRQSLNQALQALVLPIFAAAIYGDGSMEKFLMRAHQIVGIYSGETKEQFKGASPSEAPPYYSVDLPQMVRGLWEYVGSFLEDAALIERLWTPERIRDLAVIDWQGKVDLPCKVQASSVATQSGYEKVILEINRRFLDDDAVKSWEAEVRQATTDNEEYRLGMLWAMRAFLKREQNYYGRNPLNDYWQHLEGIETLRQMEVDQRPNPRYCFNAWRPAEQILLRDERTPGYRKLMAIFGQLTIARWGHVNSADCQMALYEKGKNLPGPEQFEGLMEGIYQDFERRDIHNAVLAVMQGYETEHGQCFSYGIDPGKYADHASIRPDLREASRYSGSRPFRVLLVGDAHVLWAQWLADEATRLQIERYGYEMPYFDCLLGLHTHEFEGHRYVRDPETSWLLDSTVFKGRFIDYMEGLTGQKKREFKAIAARDVAQVVVTNYDGMQLMDSQPLFYDLDFMQWASRNDRELFNKIVDHVDQQFELGQMHRKVKIEYQGNNYEISIYGRKNINLLALMEIAYPEIFALVKAVRPDLDIAQAPVVTVSFDDDSLNAFDNDPAVWRGFLLGKIKVAPDGGIELT